MERKRLAQGGPDSNPGQSDATARDNCQTQKEAFLHTPAGFLGQDALYIHFPSLLLQMTTNLVV